jgi:hypothetical protein
MTNAMSNFLREKSSETIKVKGAVLFRLDEPINQEYFAV